MTNRIGYRERQWGFVVRSCLSALDACGGSLTAWDIAVVTGQSVRLVRAYLEQLYQEGAVYRRADMWHLSEGLQKHQNNQPMVNPPSDNDMHNEQGPNDAANIDGPLANQSKGVASMVDDNYAAFVRRKFIAHKPTGITNGFTQPASMFGHQAALASWALKRGRAAIFADTGLGKTFIELVWADVVHKHTRQPVMIHTPLAVAAQIAAEGARFGIVATVVREAKDIQPGINIVNYERLHKFDTSIFGGVVLDESGCIKHHDAKTFRLLIDAYRDTPFKLPATATPAPNDWAELGTHAEFLGICSRVEMLAEFFTHDGGDTSVWRLKGHARAPFWKWVASWGALIRKPSDLGFDDGAYNLPPLNLHDHIVEIDRPLNGALFDTEAQTLMERRAARRESLDERVEACSNLIFKEWQAGPAAVNGGHLEPWVIWCELNSEHDALERVFGSCAFSIRGADSTEEKEDRLMRWLAGERPVIISKASILGFGLNMQRAARIAFVGVTDSFESYYQAVRRCWRFGQKRPVDVHLFSSSQEGAIAANLKRKEAAAHQMAEILSAETHGAVFAEVIGEATRQTNTYDAFKRVATPSFLEPACHASIKS